MDKELEVIDKLLRKRAQTARDTVACQGFDPDLASAYLEKALSGAEREQYQLHLSDCHPCRKQMSEFLLMFGESEVGAQEMNAQEAVTEAPLPVAAETKPRAAIDAERERFGLSTLWNWLFGPQLRWVMPLLILGLLAGGVWYVTKRNQSDQLANNPNKSHQSPNQSTNSNGNNPAPNQTGNDPVSPQPKNEIAKTTPTPTPEPNRPEPKASPRIEDNNVAQQPKPQPGGTENRVVEKPPVTLPSTQNPDGAINDVVDNKPGVNLTPNPTPDPKLPPPPVENSDNNGVAKNNPNPVKNPPGKTPDEARRPGGLLGNGMALTENPGVKTKVVGGKRFKLVNNVWIDEQYKQSEKQPAVTLKYGSEDYQRVIKEHGNLKQYFELGPRVIVVDNGTVYTMTAK